VLINEDEPRVFTRRSGIGLD